MASPKQIEALSDQELTKRITELLGHWPLYRKLKFRNDTLNDYPEIVRTFCPVCRGERNFDQFSWEGMKSHRRIQGPLGPEQADTARRALRTLSYRCPDCKQHWISFVVFWQQGADGQENAIIKCGQFPEIETLIDPDLEKSISEEDLVLLKKAIRARNFHFGLASVAYLRRVVENQIDPLTDKLLQGKNGSEKIRERISKARADRGFRKRLELVGKILPDYLKPNGGQNPLVHLYRLASEGVHNLPEDECIEIFDESIVVFSFVFRELHRHQTEVKSFAESLNKIVKA